MAPPPRNRIDSDACKPPNDSRCRPVVQDRPRGDRNGTSPTARAATALHLTPASGNEPHITVRISRSRPRYSPTSRSESKGIARTTCEQTTAESGQMCRQNESSATSHACSVGEYGAARAGNPPLGWHGRWQAVLSVLHVRLSHSYLSTHLQRDLGRGSEVPSPTTGR